MDLLQNHIWGPALWKVLHSSAERIGTKSLHRLPQEERRLWSNLLSNLRYSLPCPQCKKHYQSYYTTKPISTFTKEEIRMWLYHLHQSVNHRNGKPDTITPEELETIYSAPFCLSELLKSIIPQFRIGLQRGWTSREDLMKTFRDLEEIKRFYDFF
jgi:hypothetical protein